MALALRHNARPLGAGAIRGKIRPVGPYPALRPDATAGWISGDVFEVLGGRGIWRALDAYEGCHEPSSAYERRRVPVWLHAGQGGFWVTAWCYACAVRAQNGGAF